MDAIIDSADTNSDWRMDFEEYKTLMDSSFQPKEKRKLWKSESAVSLIFAKIPFDFQCVLWKGKNTRMALKQRSTVTIGKPIYFLNF